MWLLLHFKMAKRTRKRVASVSQDINGQTLCFESVAFLNLWQISQAVAPDHVSPAQLNLNESTSERSDTPPTFQDSSLIEPQMV